MATKTPPNRHANESIRNTSVLIIGAGFAGIGMAIRLQQSGIDDFLILERGAEVGGTWRDNTYPGAACDIPSHLYSYSFAPNADWSRGYSKAAEILDYIRSLVERFNLAKHIRFQRNVTGLAFDAETGTWHATTAQQETFQARSVVMAQGPLSNASFPNMAGIDTFAGHKIHSARWDHQYDFSGKRVAVIGTGASAVQIIPALAHQARQLTVFQRTAGWVLPRPDYATPVWQRHLFHRLPASQQAMRNALFWTHESMALGLIWSSPLTNLLERASLAHLRWQVKDPWLRRQLTPTFRIGCKRVLMSSDYYPALQRDNCKLVTWPIVTLTPDGIRTAEGIEHKFDCIVFATGFDVGKQGVPFPITGLAGRQLADDWAERVQAYKSINVAGYPNLFFTFGPNSGPGHNSALVYMEAQLDYALTCMQTLATRKLKWLDVLPEKQARYNADIQRRLASTNWNSGCHSWYLTAEGFNPTMYPGFASQYARQMRLDLGSYRQVGTSS